MEGGAWPFAVRGVICLVNSDNERDPNLQLDVLFFGKGTILHIGVIGFLEGPLSKKAEVLGHNRSVMLLDILGDTRNTISVSTSVRMDRLKRSIPFLKKNGETRNTDMTGIEHCNMLLNEESLVSAIHHIALISSLPFVHTARRSYQLNEEMNLTDRGVVLRQTPGKSNESLCL